LAESILEGRGFTILQMKEFVYFQGEVIAIMQKVL
jgi:hypothetical protein